MTTSTLRKELSETMTDLKKKCITTKEAREISKLASQIVYSKRLDIEAVRLSLKLMKATKSEEYKDINIKALKL